MTKSVVCILIAILVYMSMMVVIGAVYSKKNSSVGDFYLGGRRLGPVVSAMSAEASDMSSYLLMGLPGLAYLNGCAEVGWTAIGLAMIGVSIPEPKTGAFTFRKGAVFTQILLADAKRSISCNIRLCIKT